MNSSKSKLLTLSMLIVLSAIACCAQNPLANGVLYAQGPTGITGLGGFQAAASYNLIGGVLSSRGAVRVSCTVYSYSGNISILMQLGNRQLGEPLIVGPGVVKVQVDIFNNDSRQQQWARIEQHSNELTTNAPYWWESSVNNLAVDTLQTQPLSCQVDAGEGNYFTLQSFEVERIAQ